MEGKKKGRKTTIDVEAETRGIGGTRSAQEVNLSLDRLLDLPGHTGGLKGQRKKGPKRDWGAEGEIRLGQGEKNIVGKSR